MQTIQIIGYVLIILVLGLFFLWLRFQRKQERALEQGGVQEATVLVKGAYDPNVVTVKQSIPLILHFNRQEDASCSRFVTFGGLNIRKELKPFAVTDITLTPDKTGEIPFTCDMGMYQGKIVVE